MRHLPPLNALRVFEVAVRTGSYASAGIELGVTHGAVSRQIAALESWLGQKLFTKDGRRMVATPTGKMLATDVERALKRLAAAAEACARPGVSRILRVSATTSFAMRWLIPRLHHYKTANPNVDVVVTTVSTMLEELRGGVDVTIRRGDHAQQTWPHHQITPVLDDVDTLIMSPSLFARRPIRSPEDIEGHCLLASETRIGDWSDWLNAAGLDKRMGRTRQTFDHFFITRQAVEDGLGVGIGPLPMLDLDIANGRLMTPLPLIRVNRTGYVAITARSAEPGSLAHGFVAWLQGEAANRADVITAPISGR